MADEKKSGEAKDNTIPDLSDFLKEKGLLKYKDALIKAGLEEDLELLEDLDDDDIDTLIKSAKLKKFHGKLLKRIIKEYQAGTYTPTPTSGQQKRLNVLREGRKDLRGVIPRKVDIFTGQKVKTVIFIGQTGVGKTTFINSMCNYLEEISYDEQFRYKLICEENDEKVDTKETTKSQTQVITPYHLENLPALNYSAIDIVDTPGFGDTEGPQKDKQIQKKFKQFFETKCPFIDGIYFIVKASDTRVGVTQKYIFNMVLDLFGKDVKENIFVLFTFSDGSKPPALAAVKKLGIEYAKEFRINNSGFWLPDDAENNDFHETFFNVGTEQFKIIFGALEKVRTKSTKKTQETLRERANITKGLEDISKNLKLQLDEMEEEKKTCEFVKKNAAKIDKYKDKIKIPITKRVNQKKSSKTNNLNCRNCEKTCCTKCWAVSMGWCGALNWNGNCKICSINCNAGSAHEYGKYVWEIKLVTEYITKFMMARKYKLAKKKKITAESIHNAVQQRIKELERQTQETIQKMKKSVERLKEIALNPKAIGDSEYFDFLINAEIQNQETGWQKRVTQLQKMKNNIGKIQSIINAKDNKQIQQKLLNDEKSNKSITIINNADNVVINNVNIYPN